MSFELGKWKVVCDRCGFRMKNTDLRLEWTDLRVCQKCWDQKHPQLDVKGREDKQAPPWVRPEPTADAPITNDWDDF